ncbi:alpha/beta hydrolase [Wenzhouxiangella sp. EGI_FJ10305]|uniref:alpha/beta hydrolase n=1 Tax=Wenzhouxiangella sp. EGI_FJ10305 TaxID=3243768 RepID=UPI0035D7DF8E
MIRLLITLIVAYGILVLLVYLLQPRLLFMPNFQGRELTATPEQIGLSYHDVTLSTDDGETLHAWWLPHDQPRATLLFFHGNAGNISHRLDSLEIFHELGLQVFIIEYRGYGQSSGKPSEAGLYRDAEAAWNWLTQSESLKSEQIILFGRSMGGAVASELVSRVDAAGLIVESVFTSVPDIAAELYWWLPVRLLSRLEFNTADYIRRTDLPVLVVHSVDDEIIPVHHGRRLREFAGDRGMMLEIRGGHNTGFLESRDRYREGLDSFISEVAN